MTFRTAALRPGRISSCGARTSPIRTRPSAPAVRRPPSSRRWKSSISHATDMRIERIEIRVTDLKTRLQRQRSTGPYDTGEAGALLGKPVLVRIFAEGVVGYGQIRPLAPHHTMPDTYATMISMMKDVCGARLIGQRIFDVEGIHNLFDQLAPANYMARAAVDAALYDAVGKATHQPVYNLIGGLAQPSIPLEWSISMAPDPKKMV